MSDPTEAMVATVPADQTAVTAPAETVSTAPPAGKPDKPRGLLGDALADPSRTLELRKHSRGTGHRVMQELARRAVERGEINSDAITPRRLDVAQAMLREQFLFHGPPIPDAVIVEIVDEIVLPLFFGNVQA